MHKKRPAHRAWNLVRIAFLWARKRRVFRRRLITEIRLVPKLFKSFTFKRANHPKAITYREQQFSFDATPINNFKKLSPSSMRFKIPCIGRARVDYDDDFEYVYVGGNNDYDEARNSFLKDYYEDEDYLNDNDDHDRDHDHDVDEGDGDGDDDDFLECEVFEEIVIKSDDDDEEEIDVKAESFIAQFYEEMKLQRQWSHARRSETLIEA